MSAERVARRQQQAGREQNRNKLHIASLGHFKRRRTKDGKSSLKTSVAELTANERRSILPFGIRLAFAASASHFHWSRISPHAPAHPSTVFSGQNVKVFAMPSHALVNQVRFKSILANANETDWPDSPARTMKLSWATWRTTLSSVLAGGS